MSDLISGWVDGDEMRRLAESLLMTPSESDLSHVEVALSSQFEGYALLNTRLSEPSSTPSVSEPIAEPVVAPITEPPEPATQVRPPKLSPEQIAQASPSKLEEPEEPTVSPAIMQSAVDSLKAAQEAGRAGGVIRDIQPASSPSDEPKQPSTKEESSIRSTQVVPPPLTPTSTPPVVSSLAAAKFTSTGGGDTVPVSLPPKPEPRQIHSPFRRIGEVESSPSPKAEAPATSSSPESSPSGKLVRPPAPSGEDPILARVTQFGKWLKGPVGARNFFVSNTEGKILIDEVGNSKLLQVARSLAGASGVREGSTASLHVRIGVDSILEVVPTPSQFGILILGLIVEHPLPEELIREVRLGLEEVANARLLKGSR